MSLLSLGGTCSKFFDGMPTFDIKYDNGADFFGSIPQVHSDVFVEMRHVVKMKKIELEKKMTSEVLGVWVGSGFDISVTKFL